MVERCGSQEWGRLLEGTSGDALRFTDTVMASDCLLRNR